MKIRCKGTPLHTERRFLCRAVRFFATSLMRPALIETLELQINFEKNLPCLGEVTWMDKPNRTKKFKITIDLTMPEDAILATLAHEIVHVKQYATGQLRDYVDDISIVRWEGEYHEFDPNSTTSRFFAPWEQEAYGLQYGLVESFIKHYNRNK